MAVLRKGDFMAKVRFSSLMEKSTKATSWKV